MLDLKFQHSPELLVDFRKITHLDKLTKETMFRIPYVLKIQLLINLLNFFRLDGIKIAFLRTALLKKL